MTTTIPAKQLQVKGTLFELKEQLLDREIGWCTDDNTLYYMDDGNLVPVFRGTVGSGLIYLDGENGSDDNNGLTRTSAVKTMSGAIFAFCAAKDKNPEFSALKIYCVSPHSTVLPTNAEVSLTGNDTIYIYGDSINITNLDESHYFYVEYGINIIAERSATVHIGSDETGISTGPVHISGDSILGVVLTQGGIFLNATGDIQLNDYGALESSTIFPGIFVRTDKSVKINGLHGICGDLFIKAEGPVDLGGAVYVHGDATVACESFKASPGTHRYHSDVSISAGKTIQLKDGGTFYIAGNALFSAGVSYDGPSVAYVTQMEVKICNPSKKNGRSNSYTIYPYTGADKVYDEKFSSKYVFDAGCTRFYMSHGNIQNKYAEVTIISTDHVYISTDASLNVKSLNLKCSSLDIGAPIYLGFFDIDVTNVVEMQLPSSNIYMLLNAGESSTADYVSYDVDSNNSLKCGALYCPTKYSLSSYGLLHPYYGYSIKNIDIQIGMLLCPEYSVTGASGMMSPQVLGTCESGAHTFNSTISGHVGPYVGSNGPNTINTSPWNHDVRAIPSSYGENVVSPVPGDGNNRGGVITLKFDDVYETNHFWFDPDQGDDTLDGCTRKTAVKTAAALVRTMMKKCGGFYDSTNNVFNIYVPITIHILSVSSGSNRDVKWFGSPADVYALPEWAANNGIPKGIQFHLMDNYEGSRVQFQMLEFVPEAPDMSLYVGGFNAVALIAKGFFNIGFYGYGSPGISYLEASGSVGIHNSAYFGHYAYYGTRLGPISIKARDIVLYGWFTNLTAKAENSLYVLDSYGGSPDSDGNCCISGVSLLEGANVYLGAAFAYSSGGDSYFVQNKIGISGRLYVNAQISIFTRVDTVLGVVYLNAAEDISGGFGEAWFRGRFHAKCANCNLSSGQDTDQSRVYPYWSFSTSGSGGQGGAGIIDICASVSINVSGWSSNSINASLYATDVYLKAPQILGSYLNLYGNNGNGKVQIDAEQLWLSVVPYWYAYLYIRAQHFSGSLQLGSGGPWGPSDSGYYYCYVVLDIGKMTTSICVPVTSMSGTIHYDITGRIGQIAQQALSWGQVVDPDNPPTITHATFYFAVTIGRSTVEGHGIAKTGWIPDNSGDIIILNDMTALRAIQDASGNNIEETYAVQTIIAPEYPGTGVYPYGGVCMHDGTLYVCTVPGGIRSPEQWTAAHWASTDIAAQLRILQETLEMSKHLKTQSIVTYPFTGEAPNGTISPVSDVPLQLTRMDDGVGGINYLSAAMPVSISKAQVTMGGAGELLSRAMKAASVKINMIIPAAYSATGADVAAGEFLITLGTWNQWEEKKIGLSITAVDTDWASTYREAKPIEMVVDHSNTTFYIADFNIQEGFKEQQLPIYMDIGVKTDRLVSGNGILLIE